MTKRLTVKIFMTIIIEYPFRKLNIRDKGEMIMKDKKRLFAAIIASITCVGVVGLTACGNGGNGSGAGNGGNGGNGNEGGEPSIVLTENTYFNALVSEKVNEDGWKNAFSVSSCTNCTVVLREEEGYSNYLSIVKSGNNKTIEHSVCETESGSVMLTEYYDKVGDEIFWYSDTEMDSGAPLDHFVKYPVNDKQVYDDADNWIMTYTFICPNFGQLFERFTYNEQTGAYEFNGRDHCGSRYAASPIPDCEGDSRCPHADLIRTNSICEYWDVDYFQASVKIVNGKLACVEASITGNSKDCIYFYGYGTTTITLPECQ